MGDINILTSEMTLRCITKEQREALRTIMKSYEPSDKVTKLYLSDESLLNLSIDRIQNSYYGISIITTLLGTPLFNLYFYDSYLQFSERYSKSDPNYKDRRFRIYPDGRIEESKKSNRRTINKYI